MLVVVSCLPLDRGEMAWTAGCGYVLSQRDKQPSSAERNSRPTSRFEVARIGSPYADTVCSMPAQGPLDAINEQLAAGTLRFKQLNEWLDDVRREKVVEIVVSGTTAAT